jgi:hypothetical protein
MREDPTRYAAGCRGALSDPVGGGETSVVVYGVLGDIGITPTADLLRGGQGCDPVVWGVFVVGDRFVSSEVGESDSMESPVVMGCVPVSTMTKTRSGVLWRTPPPLAVLQMAAWMSWHAALWRLMRMASWSGHFPAICVHESGMRQSGHSFDRLWQYLFDNLPL